jgi:hypothetical protein
LARSSIGSAAALERVRTTVRTDRPSYIGGHAILACTDKSEAQAAKIIKLWLENNVLLVQDYTNPRTRRNATRVVLDEDKVTAIVASLRAQGAGV